MKKYEKAVLVNFFLENIIFLFFTISSKNLTLKGRYNLLSQRLFTKWQLFQNGNFPNCSISQGATSQDCSYRRARPPSMFQSQRSATLANPSRSARPNLQPASPQKGLTEPLGSCRKLSLGKSPLGNAFRKIPYPVNEYMKHGPGFMFIRLYFEPPGLMLSGNKQAINTTPYYNKPFI